MKKKLIVFFVIVMALILVFSFSQAGAKVGAFPLPILRMTEDSSQPFVQGTNDKTYLITVKNIDIIQKIWIHLFWKGDQIGEELSGGTKIYHISGSENEGNVIVLYDDGTMQIAAEK